MHPTLYCARSANARRHAKSAHRTGVLVFRRSCPKSRATTPVRTPGNDSGLSEFELARMVVEMAQRDTREQASNARVSNFELVHNRLRHVGYYLLDQTGSAELFSRIGYRPPPGARVQRFFREYPDEVYI